MYMGISGLPGSGFKLMLIFLNPSIFGQQMIEAQPSQNFRLFLKNKPNKTKGSFSQVEDSQSSPADHFQQAVFCQYMGTHM